MPGSILALIKVDRDQLGLYIKRSLAVELYRYTAEDAKDDLRTLKEVLNR